MLPKRRLQFFLGLGWLAVAVLFLVDLPVEALFADTRRNSGAFLLGVREVFGDGIMRYLAALPFLLLAWICFDSAWKPPSSRSYYDDGDESGR